MENATNNRPALTQLTGADFTDMRRYATIREQRQFYANLFDRVMAADDNQLVKLDALLPPLHEVFPDTGKKNSTPPGINAKHSAKMTKGQPAYAGLKLPLGLVQSIAENVRQESTSDAERSAARQLLKRIEEEATRVSFDVLLQLYGPDTNVRPR